MALGRRSRRCGVCGQTKKMGVLDRMCDVCRALPIEERGALRAKRKPKGDARALSGGLPGLGKRR